MKELTLETIERKNKWKSFINAHFDGEVTFSGKTKEAQEPSPIAKFYCRNNLNKSSKERWSWKI